MYQIIKNAQMPLRSQQGLYPLGDMEVGDGFDVPDDMGAYKNGQSIRACQLRNGIHRQSRITAGFKASVRRLDSDSGILRVIRVA